MGGRQTVGSEKVSVGSILDISPVEEVRVVADLNACLAGNEHVHKAWDCQSVTWPIEKAIEVKNDRTQHRKV